MNLVVPTADLVTTAGIDPSELTVGQVAIYDATGTIQSAATITAAPRAAVFYIYEGRGTGLAPVKTVKLEKGNVLRLSKTAGVAASQESQTVDFTAYTPVANDEIILKVLLTNDDEIYSNQPNFIIFQHIVTAADTTTTIAADFATQLNAYKFSKDTVTASSVGPVLTISGVAFSNFNALYFEYERSIFNTYVTGAPGVVVTTTVPGSNGIGTYEQLAMVEEGVQGLDGPNNRVHFGPVAAGNRGRITPGAPYLQYVLTGYNNDSEANYAVSGKFPSKYEIIIATRATSTNLELALEALVGYTV